MSVYDDENLPPKTNHGNVGGKMKIFLTKCNLNIVLKKYVLFKQSFMDNAADCSQKDFLSRYLQFVIVVLFLGTVIMCADDL